MVMIVTEGMTACWTNGFNPHRHAIKSKVHENHEGFRLSDQ